MNPWKETLRTFFLLMISMGSLVALANRIRPQALVIPSVVQIGQVVKDLNSGPNPRKGNTILLALSPSCQGCEESLDGLHALVTRRDETGSKTAIIAACASPELAASESKVLSSRGIRVDRVMSMDLNKARIWLYPTTLLVDAGGKVLRIWNGTLTPELSTVIGEHL